MKQAATILIPYNLFNTDISEGLLPDEYYHILGVSRKDNKTAFGLPGGKVDPGETPEQAAKRELFEETGVIAEEVVLLHDAPFKYGYHEYTYVMRKGVLPPNFNDVKEAGVVKWCSWEELTSGPFGEWNTILKEKIGRVHAAALKEYDDNNK